MRSAQIQAPGLGDKNRRLGNQVYKRPDLAGELMHLHKKDRTTKGKAIALLSSQRNSPRGVDLKESPQDMTSNRKMVLVSQATSFKGSESQHLVTEPDLPINTSGIHGFQNLKLHPYEAQSNTAYRVETNQLGEGTHQTRNQGDANIVARKSTDHTGNAGAQSSKNQQASKYIPSTDLNEMRVLRDQARRMKNNSHYTSSTQPQIATSLPSGKITILTRAYNAESSKDINSVPNNQYKRPPGGPPNKPLPPITQSQGLFFQKPDHREHSDGTKSRAPSDHGRLRPRIGTQYEDSHKHNFLRHSTSPNRHIMHMQDFQRGPDDINSLIAESVIKVNEMIASATSNMALYNEAIEGCYRPRMSSHSLEKQTLRGLASHNKLGNQSIVEDEIAPVRVVTVKAGHLPPNPRAHPRHQGLHHHLMQSLGPGQEQSSKQLSQDANKFYKKISDSDQKHNEPYLQRQSDVEFKGKNKDRQIQMIQPNSLSGHSKPKERYTNNNQPGSIAFIMTKPHTQLFNLETNTPFEIGLDSADYPEDMETNPENILCLENDRNSEEERSLLINDFNSNRKKPKTRLSSDIEGYYQSQVEDRGNNSRRTSKKSRNNINTVDIYTKNSEGEKQIQKFLIPDKAQGITNSFALLSDEECPAERDESGSPRQGIRSQDRVVRRPVVGREKINQNAIIEKPRGSAQNNMKTNLKATNTTVTKKTQIHLTSPTRLAQNISRKPTDKQISQRDKDQQIIKMHSQKQQLSKKNYQAQINQYEIKPKDTKGILKTINEPQKNKHMISTPSSKVLRGTNQQRIQKFQRTNEKKQEQKTYPDIPNLNFPDLDVDQLPEVHVEEEEFIETDHRTATVFGQGGSVKPQTTRNMKQNSFVENQALKSQSNYSEWLNSQRDSRLKGSYHEKLKLDDLNHESKNSSLKKKTMQTGPKIKNHPKIDSQTANKRQQIMGSGIASMPNFVKVAQNKPKKPQVEIANQKNQYKSTKQAPKSNHPSFVQGTGSSKQILSSNENTHLSSGQLSGRKAITKKMLGKIVKTSKLDLDPIKRKEAQLSSTQQIPAKKLYGQTKLPGSGRLATDLAAKKTSEKSFKKTGIAISTPLGSPSLQQQSLVTTKQNANRQKPYSTVHTLMGTGLQNSAPSIKKNTIHTKGYGQGQAARSSMIDTKQANITNRQKAVQVQHSGNSFTTNKKDISTRKGKTNKKDPSLLTSVCVVNQGQYQTTPAVRNDIGYRSPIYRGKQLERVEEQEFRNLADQYHSVRIVHEPKREYRSQQRHQTPSLLEKQKRELKLELERQMKYQRQQYSGSDIGPRSKNSHSKEVSGGSKNQSLQRVKFQQEHDMIYQTLDSPTSTPGRDRNLDSKKKASTMLKDARIHQAIQPFKQNVHQLLDLLQKACETPPGPIQEARGLDKFERIDQQYKMQEEFNTVVHQIKAQFKAEIRK